MNANPHRRGWVSVIIPAFNAEDTIERTLASVLTQTGVDFEVVVVDDGSTDRTADLVAGIARTDDRVRLYWQKNPGVSAARNRAVWESIGEWIAPVDADDLCYPGSLERRMRSGRAAVIYSWSVDIDGGLGSLSSAGGIAPLCACEGDSGRIPAELRKLLPRLRIDGPGTCGNE